MRIEAKDVRLVPIGELKANPKNRNIHPQDQIDRLAEIIQYQGFRQPVVVSNRSGLVVAGHGRLMAAKKLGLEQVPVLFQDFESEEQEYAFGVSDNAVAAWAELDLSGINLDIGDLGPDFDLDMLGIKGFTLDVAEGELPDLPSGDRAPFKQMTFTLHDDQAEQVERALKIAKSMGEFDSENENSNGNALARICETFLTDHGDG